MDSLEDLSRSSRGQYGCLEKKNTAQEVKGSADAHRSSDLKSASEQQECRRNFQIQKGFDMLTHTLQVQKPN
jgi:hypothetical protein